MPNRFGIMSLQAFSESLSRAHQLRVLKAIEGEVARYKSEVEDIKTLMFEADLDGNCQFELHLTCLLAPHDMQAVLNEITDHLCIDLAVNVEEKDGWECDNGSRKQLFYVGPSAMANQFRTDLRKWMSDGYDFAADEELLKREIVAQMRDYKFIRRYVGLLSELLVGAMHDYTKE